MIHQHRRTTPLLSCVVLTLLLTGCAKVSDPLPPVTAPAQALANVQLIVEGHRLMSLEFEPVPALSRVELLRLCPGDSEAEVRSEARASGLRRGISAGTRRLDDSDPRPDLPCEYWLRYQAAGRPGQSPRFSWQPQPVAEPPQQPDLSVGPAAITVSWQTPNRNIDGSSPARIEGYLVNATDVVTQIGYQDPDFEWGRRQSYRVQAISRLRDPLVLSEASPAASVVPTDTFAPQTPRNVVAVADGSRVRLAWDPSPDDDLAGYTILRGTREDALQKASPLLAVNRYTDETPPSGSTVFYRVIAVDVRGNESGPSELVRLDRN